MIGGMISRICYANAASFLDLPELAAQSKSAARAAGHRAESLAGRNGEGGIAKKTEAGD